MGLNGILRTGSSHHGTQTVLLVPDPATIQNATPASTKNMNDGSAALRCKYVPQHPVPRGHSPSAAASAGLPSLAPREISASRGLKRGAVLVLAEGGQRRQRSAAAVAASTQAPSASPAAPSLAVVVVAAAAAAAAAVAAVAAVACLLYTSPSPRD